MKQTKHTPGPWTAETATPDETACVSTTNAPYLWVCTIDCNLPVVQQNANARLIAAAPDLLEASQDLVDWLHEFIGHQGWDELIGAYPNTVAVQPLADLLRAIAKARGES